MSRLGKYPVAVPSGVKISLDGTSLAVEGPKGKLGVFMVDGISLDLSDAGVLVNRTDDSSQQRANQGLIRSLVSNVLHGVSEGFSKVLEMEGVGYRAEAKKNEVHLSLGFSHPIVYTLPEGIKAEVDKQNVITISGVDKQLVGEVAAGIRKLRPPEPYKGKGIRYQGEYVRRKAGKGGAAGG